MRCIIHIGTEKTGSTAVQDYLSANRSALAAEGVHVCTSAGKGNNRALAAAFMSMDKSDDFIRSNSLDCEKKRRSWRKKLLENISKEVRKASRSANVFIISSEHFHSRLLTEDEVAGLHAFLAPLFDDFRVICYLRRQDQMALSRYSQALRAGFTPGSPLPLRGRAHVVPPYFNFDALLQRWAQAFGETSIKPRIYSKATLFGGDIVHDFLDAAGLNIEHEVKTVNSNLALSAEAQAVLWRANEKLKAEDPVAAEKLRGKLVEYLEKNAHGRSRQPTQGEAREFYEVFRASNDAVARRWFGRDELFNIDFSEYPEEAQPLNVDRVLDLVAQFMLERID